jgi:nucleoside-diphosphate-sugar epimerase
MNTTTYRNGAPANLGGPEILVICGDILRCNGDIGGAEPVPAEGMQFARDVIAGILAAARAGGYKQCDILETLLTGDMTPRIGEMARAACDAAGIPALRQLFARIGPFADE